MKTLVGASLIALSAASGPAIGAGGFLDIPETPNGQAPSAQRPAQRIDRMPTAPAADVPFNIPETQTPGRNGHTLSSGFNSGAAVASYVTSGLQRFVPLDPDAESKLAQQIATSFDQETGRINPRDKFMNLVAVVKNTGTPDPTGRVPYMGVMCAIPLNTSQAPTCTYADAATTLKGVFPKLPPQIAGQIKARQPRAAALVNGAPNAIPRLGRPF